MHVTTRQFSLLLMMALGLGACGGGGTAGPTVTPRAAAPTADVDAQAVLCESLADLAAVHEDAAVPISTSLAEAADRSGYPAILSSPENLERMIAILDVVTEHADALADVVFPADPALVVATQDAYDSYGAAIVGLNEAAGSRDPEAVVDAMDRMLAGKGELEAALDLIRTDSAAGILDCD